MRTKLFLLICAALFVTGLHAGTVSFEVTSLGSSEWEYTYLLSGFSFQADQALDIRFDPALYGNLLTGAATGYNLVLLNPGNPAGTWGDYLAFTSTANPSLAGPFDVTFIYKGSGTPGAQPFYINQYDQNFNIISQTGPQQTVPVAQSTSTPEPAGLPLVGFGLLLYGAGWTIRRRGRRAAAMGDRS
jgi:hypothetical protein